MQSSLFKQITNIPVGDFFHGTWYGKGKHSDSGGKLLLYVSGSVLPIMYFLSKGAIKYASQNKDVMQNPATTSNMNGGNNAAVIEKLKAQEMKAKEKEAKGMNYYFRDLPDNDEMYVFATNF